MAIVEADIEFRLSGGATNTQPTASLGGTMSTVSGGVITTNIANNLWDDVSGAESLSGDIEYRGFYVKNNHASITWQTVSIWIDSLTGSADTEFDLALADEAVGAVMETIANESTAPSGPTFSRPVAKGSMVIGNVPSQSFKGIWIKRTVSAGASAYSDSGSIRAEGDTGP